MAHYEYVRTEHIGAVIHVPFRYICAECGKEVAGILDISDSKEVNVSSRTDRNPQLSSSEKEKMQSDTQRMVKYLLKKYQKQAQKGNYEFLAKHGLCPYCKKYQKWARSISNLIIFLLFTLGGIGLYALLIYGRITDGKEFIGIFGLIVGSIMFLSYIAAFVYLTIKEIKKLVDTKGQQTQLPEVLFDKAY